MIVNLESLEGLPKKFILELERYDKIFKNSRFLEDYENYEKIYQLMVKINDYCLNNKIIGFHYTNAIENDILEKGMIIRSGEDIRNDFIQRFFHLFAKDEQILIKDKWRSRFGERDIKSRDNRIYFNFTKDALMNRGAELLLTYYGGEQVYFPIYDLITIGKKLKMIGKSMILKCVLDPNDLNTFIECPWGKIIVSSYNRIINPKAHVVDQDGYQKKGISPENIEILYPERYVC